MSGNIFRAKKNDAGAVNMYESILSSKPPCPGRIVPESFIPASRFIIEAVRSPTNAMMASMIPYTAPG